MCYATKSKRLCKTLVSEPQNEALIRSICFDALPDLHLCPSNAEAAAGALPSGKVPGSLDYSCSDVLSVPCSTCTWAVTGLQLLFVVRPWHDILGRALSWTKLHHDPCRTLGAPQVIAVNKLGDGKVPWHLRFQNLNLSLGASEAPWSNERFDEVKAKTTAMS